MKKTPSQEDLEIWQHVRNDLLDWQYTGITGYLQVAGHRQLNQWAQPFADKVVVEVGCGHGHHLRYGGSQYSRYIGLDIETKFLGTVRQRFPGTRVVSGDAYALPFRDASVDCVLSVYNFEHLRRLPTTLAEIRRVLKPNGELLVGLPAEGGLLYELGRQLTSKPYMERKYRIDYDAIVHWEHWNTCLEVIEAIRGQFSISRMQYLPIFIPSVHVNVIVVLRASPIHSNSRGFR